jgi:hypothetical protein
MRCCRTTPATSVTLKRVDLLSADWNGRRSAFKELLTMKPRAFSIVLFMILASVCCCWIRIASAQQDDDSPIIYAYISRQARREQGEEYREARKVVVGDLTHDGAPETVVLYTIESQGGRNLYIQYLAVFVRRNGKLSPLTHAEVGGKSVRSVELVSVEKNSILLDTKSYGPNDPQCCPTVKGATKYVLVGRTLHEQRPKAGKRR